MMTLSRCTALLLSTCLALAASAAQADAPTKASAGVLTDSRGMTLYIFDKDSAGSGKSACNGPCATNWPPLLAMDDAANHGDYSVISRDDGKKQWAYKGQPLYLWIKDQQPGEQTGDGFNNVWHVAKP